MNEQTNNSKGSLVIVGFFLWGAVFVSLIFMWKQRSSNVATTGGGDSELVVIKGNGSSDEPDDEGTEVPEPVEIKITWPEAGVRDFSLIDSREETLSKNDLLGKPWIASFIFTRCAGPCPRVAAAFKELQKRYPEPNVNLVTFTVDPDHDTPEVLTKFASFWEADLDRWYFLTGDKDTIYNMIQKDFLMPVAPSPDPTPGWEIIHTTNICLVDQTGKVVGKYNSLKEDEIATLRRDLDGLLKK
ncbi:MAG: SCO family protein [Planctomycetaceae bacterium]|nr:SCO family protein [Planctomycetaceae bacterium]